MNRTIKRILLLFLIATVFSGIGSIIIDKEVFASDNRTVLAFTSDVHNTSNNTAANRLSAWIDREQEAYSDEIDFFGFCGDMADGTGSSITEAKYWTYTQRVMDAADNKLPGKTCYTTGNHEFENGKYSASNDYSEIKSRFLINAEANGAPSGCRIYCLGSESKSSSYTDDQITKLGSFLKGCGDTEPVIIITHYPLHYLSSSRKTTNAAKAIEVLNSAADEGKTIVFLWGHNHTESDSSYDQIYRPGDTIKYTSTAEQKIKFIYAAAGCMSNSEYSSGSASVKGKGLIVEIKAGNAMSFTYYDAEGTNVTEGGTQEVEAYVPAYAVSFNVNCHGAAPESQTVKRGDKIVRPEDPKKACCIFGGWYKEASCTTLWDFESDKVTESMTLYAKWTKAAHTLAATEAKAATDTEAGNSAYWTCTSCGKYFSDAEGNNEITKNSWIIPATGGGSSGGGSSGGSAAADQTEPTEEDKAAASSVAGQISALPAEPGLDDLDQIRSAIDAYNALTDEQKALLDPEMNIRIAAVEARYKELTAPADKVIVLINAIPADVTTADKVQVAEARAAYDALAGQLKALVLPSDVYRLEKAEYLIGSAEASAKTSALRKAKALKSRKATVTWKKTAGADGYQIVYSTSRKYTKKTTRSTTAKAGASKKTLSRLKAGKKYYVKVRAYTKVYDPDKKARVKAYGRWSKTKAFKAKK